MSTLKPKERKKSSKKLASDKCNIKVCKQTNFNDHIQTIHKQVEKERDDDEIIDDQKNDIFNEALNNTYHKEENLKVDDIGVVKKILEEALKQVENLKSDKKEWIFLS